MKNILKQFFKTFKKIQKGSERLQNLYSKPEVALNIKCDPIRR